MSFRARETAIAGKISLNELIALNDEMTALMRAGVPLDRALVQFGHDMPGRLRLGTLSLDRGERLEGGEDLLSIIETDRALYPPAGARLSRQVCGQADWPSPSRESPPRSAELRNCAGR